MKKKAERSVEVRGKQVTASQISAIAAKFSGQSEAITVWANYCAIHAIAHGNTNPLVSMLNNPAFKLASGKQSKLGKEVFAYIKFHAPQISIDAESGLPKVAEMSKNNPLRGKFADPTKLDENGKPTAVEPSDFVLSFDQWRQFEKPAKEKAEPSVKAATIAKKLGDVREAMKAGKLVASADELAELAAAAKALFMALDAAHTVEVANVEPVDAGKVAELLKSGRAGKSARAGGKAASV